MKPYPFAFHAYTRKLRPMISLFEPNNVDKVSNRIPPTSPCPHPSRISRSQTVTFAQGLGGSGTPFAGSGSYLGLAARVVQGLSPERHKSSTGNLAHIGLTLRSTASSCPHEVGPPEQIADCSAGPIPLACHDAGCHQRHRPTEVLDHIRWISPQSTE